jgi:hypothetical protein
VADLVAGHVYIAPPGTEPGGAGWTDIGELGGPVCLEPPPDVAEAAERFVATAGRLKDWSVTVSVDLTEFMASLADASRWFHDLDRFCYPRKHRHCHTCHPEQAPRPLAVNGHEYHRRQQARQRRTR